MWRRSAPIAAQRRTTHLSLRRAGRALHGLPAVFLLRLICGATVRRWEEGMVRRDCHAIGVGYLDDSFPTPMPSYQHFRSRGWMAATARRLQTSRSLLLYWFRKGLARRRSDRPRIHRGLGWIPPT